MRSRLAVVAALLPLLVAAGLLLPGPAARAGSPMPDLTKRDLRELRGKRIWSGCRFDRWAQDGRNTWAECPGGVLGSWDVSVWSDVTTADHPFRCERLGEGTEGRPYWYCSRTRAGSEVAAISNSRRAAIRHYRQAFAVVRRVAG